MSILHEKILDQKQQMDSFPGEYIAEWLHLLPEIERKPKRKRLLDMFGIKQCGANSRALTEESYKTLQNII
jgi:hypothetical protein